MSTRLPDEAFLVRALRPDEAEAALTRSVEAFGGLAPHGAPARWAARAEAGELWAVESGGVVMAHCRAVAADHFLLGEPVACQRIASVSVAPEHRGRGAAGALMRAMVRKGAHDGLALSLLFPATVAMYRGLGWELAGDFERVRVKPRLVPPIGPPLRRQDPPDWPAIHACQAAFARGVHGAGVRPEDRWTELEDLTEHVYTLESDQGLEAYALVRHQPGRDGWRYVLAVEDWAALSPRGLEAVLGFVGRHGTLTSAATLAGPAVSLLGLHLPEQDWRRTTALSWMARGLDVVAAVAARPFPSGLAVETTFDIDDPVLPETRGPWRLSVEGGAGRLDRSEAAVVRLSPRAVGPLLTGFHTAESLALAGLAYGPEADLAGLTAAFAAPRPRFLDFF